jgi:hypothetical protein
MHDPDSLIQRYIEGTLTEAEAEHLHELLKAQPALGERLLEHFEMDAMLRATKPLAANRNIQPPSRPKRPTHRFSLNKVAALTALAACITLLATWLVLPWSKPVKENTANLVAVLKGGVDLEWESRAFKPGAPLRPGLLKLKSGIAEIEFYQGARVAIEGPAEFQLISSNEATCTLGKLSASVPPQATGFRINTPKGDIVDLGTNFGLVVNPTSSEIHVFKGEVALHQASAPEKRVTEGNALSFATGLQALAANPSRFASLKEIVARSDSSDLEQFERWQARSAKMKSDPTLKLYFDFQDDPVARSVRNHAPQGEDASIVGTSWTEGRFQGKRALDFRNVSDRVRISVPGETKALTMAMSVRVNGLNKPHNSLLMSDGWGEYKVHWQILKEGEIRLALADPSKRGIGHAYDTPVYFSPERLGSWVDLAVVFDPAADEVRHYANGTLLARLPLESRSPLKIGNAELGNWRQLGNTSNTTNRYINGAIDEFALWDRALCDSEINALTK